MKTPLIVALAAISISSSAHAGDVKQIDTTAVFNARPIDTVANGAVVPMDANIDGAGGLATLSAAKLLSPNFAGSTDHVIPDDAVYPATGDHPQVVLSYANDDGKKKFARRSQGEDTYDITIPPGAYTRLFLMMSSGQGASDFDATLTYQDGTSTTKTLTCPDWWPGLKPPLEAYRVEVVQNMSKWSPHGIISSELKGHNIYGLNVQPDPTKSLVKITIKKHPKAILCFWGATGELQ